MLGGAGIVESASSLPHLIMLESLRSRLWTMSLLCLSYLIYLISITNHDMAPLHSELSYSVGLTYTIIHPSSKTCLPHSNPGPSLTTFISDLIHETSALTRFRIQEAIFHFSQTCRK